MKASPASPAASGATPAMLSVDDWRTAARDIAARQMSDVRAAVTDVLAAAELPPHAPIIAAGIGAPQVEALARTLGRETLRFGSARGSYI